MCRPGRALTPYTGPSTISTPNTVIDGKTMGCIGVSGAGSRDPQLEDLVRRRVRGLESTTAPTAGTPLLIEDSEIDCKNTPAERRSARPMSPCGGVNIHGCENGLNISQNITVEDSYIHDLYNSAEAHTRRHPVRHRALVDGRSYAAVPQRDDPPQHHLRDGRRRIVRHLGDHLQPGGDTNVLIENNLLAGGAYTLYCEQGATGINYRVLNNHFSRKFSSKVGYYGPSTDCADETQSGNVYHETGRPLPLR